MKQIKNNNEYELPNNTTLVIEQEKTKTENKNNTLEEREAIIDLWEVSREVLNKADLKGLTDIGKQILEHAIVFDTFLTTRIISGMLTHEVARNILITIQSKLSIMSFNWYGEIYNVIWANIQEQYTRGVQ